MLTLWRGEQLLGELRPRPSQRVFGESPRRRPPALSAFLVRAPDAPPVEGVWQFHHGIPGIGVQQRAVEPDIVAERYQPGARQQPNPGAGELKPMSPDEAKGVPPELQLTVRDSGDRVYLPLQIALRESRFQPEHYANVLKEAPPEALVDGVVWTIMVVFASETDAPAM